MNIKIKHSFNGGDLMTLMPGLKAHYERTGQKTIIYQHLGLPAFYYEGATHPVTNEEGQMVCMNQGIFDMLHPLIASQEYIEDFLVWKGDVVDLDVDKTRDSRAIPMPYGDIYQWYVFIFPQLRADHSKKFLQVPKASSYIQNKIIINRTQRYNNPYISYFFLKKYQEHIVFVGTEKEHIAFIEQYGLDIEHYKVKDFLELATAINSCAFFIGNQSMAFHIAEGLKVPRLLEVCAQFPNTLPHGSQGYSFLHQGALEFYFSELIHEKPTNSK
jgi:hypothetical protein